MKTPVQLEDIRREACFAAEDVAAGKVVVPGPRTWKQSVWCYQVRAWIDDEGTEGVTAHLCNTSPDSAELCKYVSGRLESLGHGIVEVVAEW